MPSINTRPDEAQHSGASLSANPGLIQICGLDLNLRSVPLSDTTPVGSQIAMAAGFNSDQQSTVLQWLDKSLEDIGPNELIDLGNGNNRFIVVESDGSWRFTIDGLRFDWPARQILVSVVRKLAGISPEKRIYLERQDEPDRLLNDDVELQLESNGVERLASRVPTWELEVQGVPLKVHTQTIIVRDALVKANINPDLGWLIYLKVKGHPKESLTLTSVIDLTRPGIEKIRLTPNDVSNGESMTGPLRGFNVLGVDNEFLDVNHPAWKAISEGGRQWLVLPNYILPEGFSTEKVSLALEIPSTYPAAQIDMFYLFPGVTLVSGAHIPATEALQQIDGQQYQRWSRHRGPSSPWQMAHDNVLTHMALVESALLKEVQQ